MSILLGLPGFIVLVIQFVALFGASSADFQAGGYRAACISDGFDPYVSPPVAEAAYLDILDATAQGSDAFGLAMSAHLGDWYDDAPRLCKVALYRAALVEAL